MNKIIQKTYSGYKDLIIWQKSIFLVGEIYKITNKYPKHESYGLISQMRRSAISIPSNISEGYGRISEKSFKLFLRISLGSLSELETQLIISNNLNYLDEDISLIEDKIVELKKMILSLIKRKK